LDSLIKKFPNLKDQSGMALLMMMLMMVLVTSVIMMTLNISGIDSNLASTNRRTTQGFHAAESGAEIAITILRDTLQQSAVPTYPAGVTVDATATAGNPLIADFVEEMTSGVVSGSDSTTSGPDATVTSLNGQTIQIDIDYEGPASLPGSELEEFGIGYHRKTGGTGCAAGTLYYIDAVANGPMNTKAQVGSAYFNCS
jgi:Tfp pilus assembly protein PilX